MSQSAFSYALVKRCVGPFSISRRFEISFTVWRISELLEGTLRVSGLPDMVSGA